MKTLYRISSHVKSLNEYRLATEYSQRQLWGEASQMYSRILQIVAPHGLSPQLLSEAFAIAKKVSPLQQNEVLKHSLTNSENIFQYVKNSLLIDAKVALKQFENFDGEFYHDEHLFQWNELRLMIYLILGIKDDTLISKLIQYSENSQQFRHRLLVGIALNSWIGNVPQTFNPIRLQGNLKPEECQNTIDHFSNAIALDVKLGTRITATIYKAFTDFLMTNRVHLHNKTVVGQIFNNYLKFTEKQKKDQLYRPLLALAWLNIQEEKYMAAEGLIRTALDLIQDTSIQSQILRAQIQLQHHYLLKTLKRDTEAQGVLQQTNPKIPVNQQVAVLYMDYIDYNVKF